MAWLGERGLAFFCPNPPEVVPTTAPTADDAAARLAILRLHPGPEYSREVPSPKRVLQLQTWYWSRRREWSHAGFKLQKIDRCQNGMCGCGMSMLGLLDMSRGSVPVGSELRSALRVSRARLESVATLVWPTAIILGCLFSQPASTGGYRPPPRRPLQAPNNIDEGFLSVLGLP